MAQAITSLVKYKDVEKLNVRAGVFESFFPLRAVGLGNESGHKLVHNGGLHACTWESMRTVTAFPGKRGAVRVLRGRTPRTVHRSTVPCHSLPKCRPCVMLSTRPTVGEKNFSWQVDLFLLDGWARDIAGPGQEYGSL